MIYKLLFLLLIAPLFNFNVDSIIYKVFKDSIDYFSYWIQMAIYHELVLIYLKNKSINFNNLKIIPTFIVIDKYQNVYPFEVSKETFSAWISRTKINVISKAKYHYNEKNYSLPYEFLKGKIML